MPHNRYRVKAKRSEVLFVDYIAEHLNPTGRAAIIVPEGIVFQSANAYKELRKYLVDDGLLYAVISLPVGIFNPYSGVKTSILLIDKSFARLKDEILFVKLNNDGFDLGAQRREIEGSEIPEIIRIVQKYHADLEPQTADDDILRHPLVTIANNVNLPVFQVDGHLAAGIHGVAQFHFFRNALEVLDGTAEVDSSHGIIWLQRKNHGVL